MEFSKGPWFLAMEFPSDITQFCGISRGEALFCMEFKGKMTNLQIPGDFPKKYVVNPLLFGFFSGIVQLVL